MMNADIAYLSIIEMAEAIRARRLSPVEIVKATLARIERLNPRLNAYCTLVPERALEQARVAETQVMRGAPLGALHGIPVAIKDTMLTAGIRTTFGSNLHKDDVPDHDSVIVERLKAAGAIIVGKTNVPEFAASAIQTENLLFGATRNPWNTDRSPGGSSGGSMVAVAAGLCQLATGSDAIGSIRIPASFCGVFGLKPSFGRVPRHPRLPPTYDPINCFGPVCRTVRDTALALEITAGRDDRDFFSLPETRLRYLDGLVPDVRGLKVAWIGGAYTPVDPEVLTITEKAVRQLEGLGAHVADEALPVKAPEKALSTVFSIRTMAVYEEALPRWGGLMHPRFVDPIRENRDCMATEYAKAQMAMVAYWDSLRPFFERYDLLATPTTAIVAPPLDEYTVAEIAGVPVDRMAWLEFLYPFNITGQPAASLPCGWTASGLPVGLQLVGRRFDEPTVLRAASALEEVFGWDRVRPPTE